MHLRASFTSFERADALARRARRGSCGTDANARTRHTENTFRSALKLMVGNSLLYQYYVSARRIMYVCRTACGVTNIGISAGEYRQPGHDRARHVFCLSRNGVRITAERYFPLPSDISYRFPHATPCVVIGKCMGRGRRGRGFSYSNTLRRRRRRRKLPAIVVVFGCDCN